MAFTMDNEEVAQLLEDTAKEIRRLDQKKNLKSKDFETLGVMISNIELEIESVIRTRKSIDTPEIQNSFRKRKNKNAQV